MDQAIHTTSRTGPPVARLTLWRQPPPERQAAARAVQVALKCVGCAARHVGMCAAASNADLNQLSDAAEVVRVEPGRRFIEEGDKSTDFYTLTEGTVRLLKTLADGRQQIVSFAGPGDFLGLAIWSNYAYCAEAIDHVRLCRFSRPRLGQLIADLPDLEARLLEITRNELVLAQEQMLLLGRKNARERLASFLLARAGASACLCAQGDAAMPVQQPVPVPLPMTRGDIADYLGLRIETISRVVTQLKAARLIDAAPNAGIVIRDVAGLLALAGGG